MKTNQKQTKVSSMNIGSEIIQEIINLDFEGNFNEFSFLNESSTDGTGGTGGTGGNVGGACCSGQGGVGNSYGGTNGIGNHHGHTSILASNNFTNPSLAINKTSSVKEIMQNYQV